METTSRFDLNQSVRQWRDALSQSATMRAEELDELEHHLRDSVTQLRERQLSEEESFLIATRRLGGGEVLTHEYAKANPGRVWTSRCCWMLGGLFLFQLLAGLPGPVLQMLTQVTPLRVSGHWLGLITVLIEWAALLLPIGLLVWLANSKPEMFPRWVTHCLRRPVLFAVGLLVVAGLLFILPLIPWLTHTFHYGSASWTQEAIMRRQTVSFWQLFGFSLLQHILIPVALVWLARRTLMPRLAK